MEDKTNKFICEEKHSKSKVNEIMDWKVPGEDWPRFRNSLHIRPNFIL